MIPPKLAEIIEDFQFCEGREKLELLLQYSEEMPPLPDGVSPDKNMHKIHECMSPVFVHAEKADGKMTYTFDVPREAPTVRGYASILGQGLNGTTPEETLAVPNDFFIQMGLHKVITGQRLNGISAIMAYIKTLAKDAV